MYQLIADKFFLAAEKGNTELVSVLIDLDVDINHQQNDVGHSALSKAVLGEHVDIVELLLKNKADPRFTIHVDGETYPDLSHYLSREHSHRLFDLKGVTKFGHLVSTIHYQIQLLNSPDTEHIILLKIEDSISKAKE